MFKEIFSEKHILRLCGANDLNIQHIVEKMLKYVHNIFLILN